MNYVNARKFYDFVQNLSYPNTMKSCEFLKFRYMLYIQVDSEYVCIFYVFMLIIQFVVNSDNSMNLFEYLN